MPRRTRPTDEDRRPAWAKWLIAQRESRGWLQREFAERINVSQQSLSGYERGIYRVPEDVAEQVATALKLPYLEVRAQLGMFVPEEAETSDEDGELIRYQLPRGVRLTPLQRKALIAVIDAFVEAHVGASISVDAGFPDRDVDVVVDRESPAAAAAS